MWKRITKFAVPIILCLIVILLVVPGCTKEAPKDKIVVGMSRSLSGPIAQIDDSAFRPVYETWVPMVNAEGGVYVEKYKKKLPIELKIYDDKSDPPTMAQLTEKLILEDKVDFIWGGGGTDFIFAGAPICNKYKYICITAEGGASSLIPMLPDMPYVFITLSFSNWYEMPVLADMLKSKGATSAYVMYINALHGVEYRDEARVYLAAAGIEIKGETGVPPDIKDLSSVIKEAKDSGADAFLSFCYPDQNFLAVGTAMELDYNPKAFLGGPGMNFGFFHTGFGPVVEGVMGWASWNRKSSPALNELADKLYTGKPEDANDWWGHPFYWAGLDMWKAAVEKAGTLDQTKIRDILAEDHLNTVLGETWFENGLLAKETHPGEVGQWINGTYEVVGPFDKATAEWVYPKPAWPK